METHKKALIVLVGTFTLARFIALGFVISKHGEDKKSKYNGYGHFIVTLVNCWVLYELILQD